MHSRGAWAFELTGSVFFFAENDDFVGNGRRKQDPLPAARAYVIYTFRPGLWTSLSAGYGWEGQSTINGVSQEDAKGDFLSAVSVGTPINRQSGIRLSYVRARTREEVGSESDNISIAYSRNF